MIVLLNPSNRTVTICDKVVKVYSWNKINEIAAAIQGKDVLYVSEILSVTGDEVLSVIVNENDKNEDAIGDQTHTIEGELYIHTKSNGKYSATYQGKNYMFNGMYDVKPITSLPEGMLEKCPFVVDCLKNNTMEIIDENEKELLMQQYEQEIQMATESINKAQEIIKGSVDDPIEIDLGASTSFKRGKK